MKTITIKKEIELDNFDFWGGATYFANWLGYDDFEIITEYINECFFDDTLTETTINDFFWFDNDIIAEWLGYEDWEDLENQRSKKFTA